MTGPSERACLCGEVGDTACGHPDCPIARPSKEPSRWLAGARHLCDEYVEHPTDVWGGCYCKLPADHEGAHSGHYTSHMRSGATDGPTCSKPIDAEHNR
jgi:hypothetical protein